MVTFGEYQQKVRDIPFCIDLVLHYFTLCTVFALLPALQKSGSCLVKKNCLI